jgi:hypothetical protein
MLMRCTPDPHYMIYTHLAVPGIRFCSGNPILRDYPHMSITPHISRDPLARGERSALLGTSYRCRRPIVTSKQLRACEPENRGCQSYGGVCLNNVHIQAHFTTAELAT